MDFITRLAPPADPSLKRPSNHPTRPSGPWVMVCVTLPKIPGTDGSGVCGDPQLKAGERGMTRRSMNS